MKRWLLALVFTIACKADHRSVNDLPAETWTVADYTKAGVPAPDHAWSLDELQQAVNALATATQGHRERLPHQDGTMSGPVFAKLVEATPVDGTVSERFGAHGARYEAMNQLSKLYMVDATAAVTPEWLALIGNVLQESAALQVDVAEFLASFGPDDPKHDVRVDGVATMRRGWGQMLEGGLMMLADLRVAMPVRVRFARVLRRVFPVLIPALLPEQQTAIQGRLKKLHEFYPNGPLAEAMPPL
jgi:hypothetical protein